MPKEAQKMATQERTAAQINLIAKLGEVASISGDLHKGQIHGSIRAWVPIQEEEIQSYMLQRLARLAIACAQAQQIIIVMEKKELPKFLLVTANSSPA